MALGGSQARASTVYHKTVRIVTSARISQTGNYEKQRGLIFEVQRAEGFDRSKSAALK